MADEEEIRSELEAVQAVYGDDCRVIQIFPPHLAVHFKPRTADDASQQFVEVTLGLKSDREYPRKPPYVYIIEMKGLDENRQTHLVAGINDRAQELSSCLMLVALCEEAVDILSSMNHPEGNCPLCLFPLVTEGSSATLPFMKLMSCYHCFHSECIIRFWNWIQEQNATNDVNRTCDVTSVSLESERGTQANVNQCKANCPVCRKLFDAMDMEHVLDYLSTSATHLSSTGMDIDEDEKVILHSDLENDRREKFEALLKLQQEKDGLIEPKKTLLILPGMFLPENPAPPNTSPETRNWHVGDGTAFNANPEMDSGGSSSQPTTSNPTSSHSRRKKRVHSSRRPLHAHAPPGRQQWMKKEKDTPKP